MEDAVRTVMDRVVTGLRGVDGVEAIGLAGSHALGDADAYSDLDVVVFCGGTVPDFECRTACYGAIEGMKPPRDGHLVSVGFEEPPLSVEFYVDQSRVDGLACDVLWTTVEGWRRMFGAVAAAGKPEWLVAGIGLVVPLHDPGGVIGALQADVPAYTQARARQKVWACLGPAHFWLCDVGSLAKAARRGQVVEYHRREAEMVERIIGAVAAVNRCWHVDHRRLARDLAELEIVPERLAKRLDVVLGRRDSYADLATCEVELRTLFAELAAKANAQFSGWKLPMDWFS